MDVTVGRPDADPVNAKSILLVLGLDVRHGEEIVISAEGDGADAALDELVATVTTNGA
jgi:phosphocarrier protein